jgi:hypothetical protein
MPKLSATLFILLFLPAIVNADLIVEQQIGASNLTATATLQLHGDKMRLDQSNTGISVIVDLKSRDSYTLLTNQTYLFKFGSEVRWEMKEELKYTHGTNEMDAPAAPSVDTGKTEVVNGIPARIFHWTGAYGRTMTLWVATNFPNYNGIKTELAKVDVFNETGPHPNAQPALSALPGMVVKSKNAINGHEAIITLVSAKLEPLDPVLFEIPPGYTQWKSHSTAILQTNPPPAH